MHKIFNQIIDPQTISQINEAVDKASDGDSIEILIPPKSTEVLAKFKNNLLLKCNNIHWDNNSYVVIRTVTNKGAKAAGCWHFDNFRDTTLIVLRATQGVDNGDLLVRNNLRGSPKLLLWYMITKIFWTNPITWFFLRIKFIRDKFFTRVPLKAGDVMMFDGATTYHGNLQTTSGMRRSILIHNDPLFKDAAITKLFHKLNKLYLYKN